MRKTLENQNGAVLVTFALILLVLLGFTAIATEAGRWYMIRAELSKSVDAGALAGAKNMGNPFVDPLVLAQEFGQANFAAGYGGSEPLGTAGSVVFTASALSNNGIQVNGSVTALGYLSQLFGVNTVAITASGAARQNRAQIMLVLDRSGSMAGQPENDLKTAATSFVGFFQDTQNTDKMGMVSFSTNATVDVPLGYNYVTAMTNSIAGLYANGGTNSEDALAQAHGPNGLPDQTNVAPDQKVQQFLIFFTDGQPTAFRGNFTYAGTNYDGVAVVYSTSAALSDCLQVAPTLYDPNTGNQTYTPDDPTGNGVTGTKWQVMTQYPVPGYSPDYYGIPNGYYGPLPTYLCQVARQLGINEAQIMKNSGVIIYTIGLGNLDTTFLSQVASGPAYEYNAPTSSDLQRIFNLIAKDIKLRLVQ